MPASDSTVEGGKGGSHEAAARAFASRIRDRFDESIESIVVFGSTARGDAAGLSSDVDVLVVLDDEADRPLLAEALRDVAYDVMLEYGPVIELHVLTRSRYETLRERRNPFVRNVVSEGKSYG